MKYGAISQKGREASFLFWLAESGLRVRRSLQGGIHFRMRVAHLNK